MALTKSAALPFVALIAVGIASPTPRANACENGVVFRVDPLVQAVSRAEQSSARGDQAASMQNLVAIAPDLRSRKLGASSVSNRALRVAARAILRSGGDVGFTTKNSDHERTANLEWAAQVMRGLAVQAPSEPETMADLGEALERVPGQRGEAKRLLGALEKADTMTSPFGYAALARIKARPVEEAPSWIVAPLVTLDAGTALLDLARCRAMTKNASICGDETAKKG